MFLKASWIGRWTGLLKYRVLLEIDLLLIGFRQIRTDDSTGKHMPKRRGRGGTGRITSPFPVFAQINAATSWNPNQWKSRNRLSS